MKRARVYVCVCVWARRVSVWWLWCVCVCVSYRPNKCFGGKLHVEKKWILERALYNLFSLLYFNKILQPCKTAKLPGCAFFQLLNDYTDMH
jgi:hypothetical protein